MPRHFLLVSCTAVMCVAFGLTPSSADAQQVASAATAAPSQPDTALSAAIIAVVLAETAKHFPNASPTDGVSRWVVLRILGLDSAATTALEHHLRSQLATSNDSTSATWRYEVEVGPPTIQGDSAFVWVTSSAATRCRGRWKGNSGGNRHVFVRAGERWQHRGAAEWSSGTAMPCDTARS